MPTTSESQWIDGRWPDTDRLATVIGRAVRPRRSIEAMPAAFDLLPDSVFCIDRRLMTFSGVNRAACRCLGYSRNELLGIGPRDVCPPVDVAAIARQLDDAMAEGPATAVIRTVQRRKDGLPIPAEWHVSRVPEAGGEYWIVVARELSIAGPAGSREDARSQTYGLGMPGHDPLTGLPDRRLFARRLDQALQRVRRDADYVFAVCFIDLDGFKAVNDGLGHLAGDRILRAVAQRLAGGVRPGDMAARFGGDEFTVLIDALHGGADAQRVARRILRHLETPMAIDGRQVKVTASIGIAMSSRGKAVSALSDREDLLRNADRAMYRAKSLGGGELAFFEDEPPPRADKPQ
jgi:diguanylate cyclase (GGDEF)-like protein/PAS domain S-box-containing protein